MEEVKVNSRGITNRFSSYDSFLKVVAMQEIIYQANTKLLSEVSSGRMSLEHD